MVTRKMQLAINIIHVFMFILLAYGCTKPTQNSMVQKGGFSEGNVLDSLKKNGFECIANSRNSVWVCELSKKTSTMETMDYKPFHVLRIDNRGNMKPIHTGRTNGVIRWFNDSIIEIRDKKGIASLEDDGMTIRYYNVDTETYIADVDVQEE